LKTQLKRSTFYNMHNWLTDWLTKLTNYLTPWRRVLLQKLNSVIQEFPHILWNPKVHYNFHKNLPLVPILNQIYSVLSFLLYFPMIHSNIIFPSTSGSSKWSLHFSFPTKNFYAFFFMPMCATCPGPSHLPWRDDDNNNNNNWWSI